MQLFIFPVSTLFFFIKLISSENVACREKQSLLGTDYEDFYDLTEGVEGSTFQLKCHYCNEQDDTMPKLWFFEKRLVLDDIPEEVKLGMSQISSENHFSMEPDHTLTIQNLSLDDAGIYFCFGPYQDEYTHKYNYFLDVILKPSTAISGATDDDFNRFVNTHLHPINSNFTSSNVTDFADLRHIYGILLVATIDWEPWTACDACAHTRQKRAKCILTPSIHDESVLQKMNITDETSQNVYLNLFQLSCYSLELRNTFPKIYDLLQTVPEFKLVEACTEGVCDLGNTHLKREPYYRNHYMLTQGSDLFLICPESSMDSQIVWRKDGKLLEKLHPDSNILIDSFSVLYIIDGSMQENGNYTCFVDGLRMQETIVVFVSVHFLKSAMFKRHSTYLMSIFILCLIVYLGGIVVAYFKRKSFRQLSIQEFEENLKPKLLQVEVVDEALE